MTVHKTTELLLDLAFWKIVLYNFIDENTGYQERDFFHHSADGYVCGEIYLYTKRILNLRICCLKNICYSTENNIF